MKVYKTSDRVRTTALAYYYANREACLAKMAARRRGEGVPVARPKLTDAEKLAVVRICKCGRQVTTPSLLRQCSNVCRHCRAQTPVYKRGKAKYNRKAKRSPAHLRFQVTAYKEERGCERCGARPKRASSLHFHHRDRATKEFKIARGVYTASAKRLWAEVAKCDVLCKGCHEEAHA